MFQPAEEAVAAALAAGAGYADARVVKAVTERIDVQDGHVQSTSWTEGFGLGVRALHGSAWGFAATSDLSRHGAGSAGFQAMAVARASAAVPGPPLDLAEIPVEEASWETPFVIDPASVPLSDKVQLLLDVSAEMADAGGVRHTTANLTFHDTNKWLVSSEGHRIHQHLVESGGGYDATAVGEREIQRRSYPQSFGQFETGGYEVIDRWDFRGHAGRVADEAAALLRAPALDPGRRALILEGSQVALQIHESVGHAIELDRILGWEAAFAGTSHLELARLGKHRYGSELMNITADATIPGALGTFGYDDEGTPAQAVDIVTEGVWVGALTGRDSAHRAGLRPGGMVRADGYARIPMVRMTNVGLLPGDSSLDEMISDTKDGVYMATNRSWSIDDKRLNFQFGCEIGWEIRDGKLGRMVRNPTYTGITPVFWAGLDRVGGRDEWVPWGTPNCGKGQPLQVGHTGHPASPARFADVRVGVQG